MAREYLAHVVRTNSKGVQFHFSRVFCFEKVTHDILLEQEKCLKELLEYLNCDVVSVNILSLTPID